MSGFNFNHKPIKVPKVNSKYRKIVTDIPVSEDLEILKNTYKLESRSMHGQLPIVWSKAEDFQIYDSHGNCWLDFTSTIFVSNAGHGNRRILDAVKKVIPLLSKLSGKILVIGAGYWPSKNQFGENKSVILLLPRVIDIPSTVNAASVAATTWVALSLSEATSPGLYFKTLFSVLLR